MHDVRVLDDLPIGPGAFYSMDRRHIDFTRMDGLNRGKAFFVTRTKRNMEDTRLTSPMIDKSTVLRSDQTIRLQDLKSSIDYPTRCDASAITTPRSKNGSFS